MNRVCPICNCNLKDVRYVKYGNHINSKKKFILEVVYVLIFFFLPKSFFNKYKIPRRITKSIWFGSKIILCRKCGSGHIDKIPSSNELNMWYNTSAGAVLFYKDRLRKITERDESQYKYVRKFVKLGCIDKSLEFGAGEAGLSRKLCLNHPKILTETVDISEKSNEQLRNHSCIDNVEKSIVVGKKYDLIVCSHVLHMVNDMPSIFGQLVRALTKGGYMFIEIPNCNDLYLDLDFEDYSFNYFLQKSSILELIKFYGLELIDVQYLGITWHEVLNGVKQTNMYSTSSNASLIRFLIKK